MHSLTISSKANVRVSHTILAIDKNSERIYSLTTQPEPDWSTAWLKPLPCGREPFARDVGWLDSIC